MTKILGRPGEVKLLLGNEAIARGAIEAGVNVATGYPGTPSTEILESIIEIADEFNVYVEWSVNEKVALEVALGASICGLRSISVMKHVGLNVASDVFMSLGYCGVKGGLLIVSADDPNCYSSQNEQDNRWYGVHAFIPVYEPSTPSEAKELVKKLFSVSEKFETAVLLRITTRLAHTCGNVILGEIEKSERVSKFMRESSRWVLLPINARRLKKEVLKKIDLLSKFNEDFEFNIVSEGKNDKLGIITCGVAYCYVMEALDLLNLVGRVPVLKLTSLYPLPRELIENFISNVKEVLVVEEVDPFIETLLKSFVDSNVEIHGKDYLPKFGELDVNTVVDVLTKLLEVPNPLVIPSEVVSRIEKLKDNLPPRPPTFCPGCPHRASFYIIKKACEKYGLKDVIYCGDIGCYTLGYFPPFKMIDTTLCMGASIGLANSLSKFGKKLVIAVIGDSTFYHTGIPPLINALYNGSNFLVVILDNCVTAMTGMQPHPGTGFNASGLPTRVIKLEDVVLGLGVEEVFIIDPYVVNEGIEKFVQALKLVLENNKLTVVIFRRECVLYARKLGKRFETKYEVDVNKCVKCLRCIREFGCPAIRFDGGVVRIDPSLCTGCGVCSYICPVKAIMKR